MGALNNFNSPAKEILSNISVRCRDGDSCCAAFLSARCWFVASVIDLAVTTQEWARVIHVDNKETDFISGQTWFEIAHTA